MRQQFRSLQSSFPVLSTLLSDPSSQLNSTLRWRTAAGNIRDSRCPSSLVVARDPNRFGGDRLAGDEFQLTFTVAVLVDVLDSPARPFEQQQRRGLGEANELGSMAGVGDSVSPPPEGGKIVTATATAIVPAKTSRTRRGLLAWIRSFLPLSWEEASMLSIFFRESKAARISPLRARGAGKLPQFLD